MAAPDPALFFVTGGTLQPDAPSYVERRADVELMDGLSRGDYCYVLTSRQMGKSSLMVRTVRKLRTQGKAAIVLDLTAIGQNVTAEQWYDGLCLGIGRQLDMEAEMDAHWHAHSNLGSCQRLFTAIHDLVLPLLAEDATAAGETARRSSSLVIFIDELDVVRSLPFSTDEFFAAIRECYNRRGEEPQFKRICFCLLGVATPGDLIRDARITPFNIGRRIELDDFTREEVGQLEPGLSAASPAVTEGLERIRIRSREVLDRIYFWTGGHPFLTQRLCRAVRVAVCGGTSEEMHETREFRSGRPRALVDRLCQDLFFSHRAREKDDNLMFVRDRVLRGNGDRTALLDLYSRVRSGKVVPDDEMSPICGLLRLAGLVRVRGTHFEVRNRIYRRVFDVGWIELNTPEAELKRQKGAFRRGVRRGLMVVGSIVLANALTMWFMLEQLPKRREFSARRSLGLAYRQAPTYRDEFQVELEADYLTLRAVRGAAGSLVWRNGGDFQMQWASGVNPRLEVSAVGNGNRVWNSIPSAARFMMVDRKSVPNLLVPELSNTLGALGLQPFVRMFLPGADNSIAVAETAKVYDSRHEVFDGLPVFVLSWRIDASALLAPIGLSSVAPPSRGRSPSLIPVTAWIEQDRGFVRQMELDLTAWAPVLLQQQAGLNLKKLVLRERRRRIRVGAPVNPGVFDPDPARMSEVRHFDLSQHSPISEQMVKSQLERLVPSRLRLTPPGLVDLSAFYNAALNQRWHPGPDGNDLSQLPPGVVGLNGVLFEVRGLVQLNGRQLAASGADFPNRVEGIPVGRKASTLHFLQATAWRTERGREAARVILHYHDGQQRQMSMQYGIDFSDWHEQGGRDSLPRATVAWRGRNDSGASIRLFQNTRENPRPDASLDRIDYISTASDAAPFLVALTVEPWE